MSFSAIHIISYIWLSLWSALFSNLSKSGLDIYVVKRSKRPLLEEVA